MNFFWKDDIWKFAEICKQIRKLDWLVFLDLSYTGGETFMDHS